MNKFIYFLLLTTPEYTDMRNQKIKEKLLKLIPVMMTFYGFKSLKETKEEIKGSIFVQRKTFDLYIIIFILLGVFALWNNYPNYVQFLDKKYQEEQLTLVNQEIPKKNETVVNNIEQNNESDKLKNFKAIGEKYGTYGDTYGSLNTLFSGLASALLLITMFMQRRELQDQREEIKRSNDIADQQRIIGENQEKLIQQQIKDTRLQNFNSTFFKYLDEKKNKLNNLTLTYGNTINGETCFTFYKGLLLESTKKCQTAISYYTANKQLNIDVTEVIVGILIDDLNDAEKQTQNLIDSSNYFEYYHFIFEFLETTSAPEDFEKNLKVFISFCSTNELICFLWHAISNVDYFLAVKKYNLLELINFKNHSNIYTVFNKIFYPEGS